MNLIEVKNSVPYPVHMFTRFSMFGSINSTICEDELCGFIDVDDNNQMVYRERDDYDQVFVPSSAVISYCQANPQPYPIGKYIYLGLESPHIHEYKINPIRNYVTRQYVMCRPAVGTTGTLIKEKIIQKIGHLLREYGPLCLPVIKFNLVQIQCSCGEPTKKYRDENFVKALFDNTNTRHYTSLLHRLNSAFPGYFFNCCTKGNCAVIKQALTALNHPYSDKYELRVLVEDIIRSNQPQGMRYHCLNQHPSQWWK